MLEILILEDNDNKFNCLKGCIEEYCTDVSIERASFLNEARKKYKDKLYDLFIFDMQIPKIKNGQIDKKGGCKVLDDLKDKGRYKHPRKKVCMTEFEESYLENIDELDKEITLFIKYAENSIEWEEKVEKIISELNSENLITNDNIKNNRKILFSLSGFNSRGAWKNNFSRVISEEFSDYFIHVPWDYGNFGFTKIISNKHKSKKIEEFQIFYNSIVDKHHDKEIYVVAHSFGSHIIGESLKRYNEIKFDKILLLGNVLDTNYPWKSLVEKGKVKKVKSFIGGNDSAIDYSWLAKLGNAGKKGFVEKGDFLVEEKYEHMKHSDMFGIVNMRNYWLKFFMS